MAKGSLRNLWGGGGTFFSENTCINNIMYNIVGKSLPPPLFSCFPRYFGFEMNEYDDGKDGGVIHQTERLPNYHNYGSCNLHSAFCILHSTYFL